MPQQVRAVVVDRVLGWKLDDARTHALIGVTDPQGTELQIAVSEESLWNVITGLIAATAAFPLRKGLGAKEPPTLEPDWFDFGHSAGRAHFSLSFHFPHKGHLTFRMGRAMTQRLFDAVQQELSGSTDPTPGTPRH